MIRSGSTRQSMTPSLMNSGRASTTGTKEARTSRTAWWNSGSAGFRATTRSIRLFKYSFFILIFTTSKLGSAEIFRARRRFNA